MHIKRGYDLKVTGKPDREMVSAPHPKSISVQPTEFHGVKPKLLVKEGESVRGGTPLFFDKNNPDVQFVAPHSGRISSITYGERRTLTNVIIEPDRENDRVDFAAKSIREIREMTREQALSFLQQTGAFTYIRQRPFNKIPDGTRPPKSVFINCMNTEPNAVDQVFILKDRMDDLLYGVKILKRLTDGEIHLCYGDKGGKVIFDGLEGVEYHTFSGPHPAGLVSTHIHFVDPINKGDIVWYINAKHLASIGSLLKTGYVDPERVVAVSGGGVRNRKYYKTIIGADVETLIGEHLEEGENRIISGTVLNGTRIQRSGHILFYENNLQVIPEGRERRLMGWAMPGLDQFSATSRVFLSSFFPAKERNVHTNLNGGRRAIIWTDVYDRFTPLDIYTNFLVKAVLAEDVDEAEKLGILEVAEEDFALATYACPSKVDIGAIIGKGLEMIEKEGY